MLALLALHAVAACLAPLLVRRLGRAAFVVLAGVPALALGWLAARVPDLGGAPVTETVGWLPALEMDVALRLDPLSATLALLVTGVGALVLVYCAQYFPPGADGLGRLAGVLTAFAGAMLGLVVADNVLVLYVFWELTTVFSYLLIGQSAHRRSSRRAALQALLVTTAGGLAMLVGLIVLGEQSSYLLTEMVADPPPAGLLTGVALVLVLAGALSKSAIVPTHFWLPAAMAAPTPVSAYLHAAAMVKAGVFLVAVLAPAFADAAVWRPLVVPLGLATMVLGGWRALRQTDLKLLLAFGTVSQLGFLLVLLGAGTREAALAGLAMLVAHATFKSALFLVVGIVDHSAGTRDLTELSGVGRRMPVLAALGTLAAVSMAGVPPTLGFVGKEAAYEAFTHPAVGGQLGSWAVLAGLVAGSALTTAYSARFVWGAFATKPDEPARPLSPPGMLLVVPAAVLALATAGLGAAAPLLDEGLSRYADTLPATVEEAYHLALWHGLSLPLLLSVVSLGGGLLLFVRRRDVDRFLRAHRGPGDADLAYRWLLRRLDSLAGATTAVTQRGSLPTYLAVVLLVLLALPGTVLVTRATWPVEWQLWDHPAQPAVAAVMAVSAVAATLALQRLSAVLLVGVTGYGVAVLFALGGAPDLALTAALVETITLVVFVLVLRTLPKQIVDRHTRSQQLLRAAVAVPMGLLLAGLGAVAIGARDAEPLTERLAEGAYDFGGGKNVVNVALVDIRAWDTLGEISVLVVAATGVASLVFLRQRTGAPPGVAEASQAAQARGRTADAESEHRPWLRAGRLMRPDQRAVVLEVVTRLVFHTVVLLSVYLLLSGHNVPGGGFAGGLVAGLALVVRYLAGGRYELGEAAPLDAGVLLGSGLLLAGGTGIAGLLLGGDVLQSAILEATVPLYGDVKLVTTLFFDVGVYLIVVGLVLDILRSLGAEIDRQGATR